MKLENLRDDSRLWIFPVSEPLDGAAAGRLLSEVDRFLTGWASHGEPNVGALELREGRFLLVAADESNSPSGCSIDKLFGVLESLERELAVSLLDTSRVYYRAEDGEVRSATRAEFRRLAEQGALTAGTVVFDPSLSSVGELRAGRFERPAGETWHRELLPAAAL